MITWQTIPKLLWRAIVNWSTDNIPRLGASVAYYTLFSIAPMLLVVITIAGLVFGPDAVRGRIVTQLDGVIGHDGAKAIQTLLEGAYRPGSGYLAIVIGSVTFLLATTGAFLELQHALNTVFHVKADPSRSQVSEFVRNRVRSFGLVLTFGFLLLVSLVINAGLTAVSDWAGGLQMIGMWPWQLLNTLVSIGVITSLFAMIFRFLPDVRLAWRDVWTGAAITSMLFLLGKEVIGYYLGRSSWTSTYGTIGSVLILLLWIYYSAQVFLFGAEFTRLLTEHVRGTPRPDSFAKKAPSVHPSATRR